LNFLVKHPQLRQKTIKHEGYNFEKLRLLFFYLELVKATMKDRHAKIEHQLEVTLCIKVPKARA